MEQQNKKKKMDSKTVIKPILKRSQSSLSTPECNSNGLYPQLPSSYPSIVMSTSLSASTTPNNNHRLPYYYPPSDDYIGQYDYGTFFTDKLQQSPTSPNNPLLDDKNEYVRCENGNTNQQNFQESNHYQRYRYYNRLFNSSENFEKGRPQHILLIPNHVIPWYFMLPKVSVPSFEVAGSNDRDVKQSSIVTIFAIWNMMMGTSLLCLPWAYHQAGLIGGILIILMMGVLCFFTASLVIKVPLIAQVKVNEFTDLCSLLLGNVAHKISQISSLSILAGGCIVYWVLMSNFLRHIISFVYQVEFLNMTVVINASSVACDAIVNSTHSNDEKYLHFMEQLDYIVPAILVLLIGPITCLRSVNIFLKFNIIGTLSVFYLLAFALFKAYSWDLVHISFDPKSTFYVKLFDWNFPIYTGVLSLAMFIHNCLTTLLKTQKNPQNNMRDLAIAYTLSLIHI